VPADSSVLRFVMLTSFKKTITKFKFTLFLNFWNWFSPIFSYSATWYVFFSSYLHAKFRGCLERSSLLTQCFKERWSSL